MKSSNNNYLTATVFGIPALISVSRIQEIPEGFYKYDVSYEVNAKGWFESEVSEHILFNWLETIITKEPIELDSDGFRPLRYDGDKSSDWQDYWLNDHRSYASLKDLEEL